MNRGFTLTEMAIVLALAALMLTLAAPSYLDLVRNQRIAAASGDFLVSVNVTRTEAMQRGERIDMVPADGVDWSSGWTVFADANGNQIPDAGEKIVFSHGPVADKLRITSSLTDSARKYLAYDASGRSRTHASSHSPQSGTISFVLGKQIRRIKINFLGRPRLCDPAHDNTCTGNVDAE